MVIVSHICNIPTLASTFPKIIPRIFPSIKISRRKQGSLRLEHRKLLQRPGYPTPLFTCNRLVALYKSVSQLKFRRSSTLGRLHQRAFISFEITISNLESRRLSFRRPPELSSKDERAFLAPDYLNVRAQSGFLLS